MNNRKENRPEAKKGLILLVSLLLSLALLTGCGEEKQEIEKEVVNPQVSVMAVDTLPEYAISEIGVIKPIQEIELIAKGAGTIDTVNVSVGDAVKKDQILAVIDQDDQNSATKINLDNAKLQLNNAEGNLAFSRANNSDMAKQAEIQVSTLEQLSEKLNRNLEELKEKYAQNLIMIEFQIENATKAQENAKTGYDSTVSQVSQSWANYYKNAKSSVDSVFLNTESYWQLIDGMINSTNREVLIWNRLPAHFGARNQQQKNMVANAYNETKDFYEKEKKFYDELDVITKENIDNVLSKTRSVAEKMHTLNMNIRLMLDDSITTGSFTQFQLDGLKSQMVAAEGRALGDINAVDQLGQGYESLQLNEDSQVVISKNNLDVASNQLKNAENELAKFKTDAVSVAKDLEAQIEQTKKDLLSAKTNLASAKRTVGIQNNSQEYEINALKNQVRMAEKTLGDNKVVSSIDGVISEINIDKGDYVAPGTMIGKVIRYSQVKVVFHVDKNMVKKIKLNQPINFFVSNDINNKLGGVISKVAPMADTMSKKFRIEAIAGNKNLSLKPETFVSVSIDLSKETFDKSKTYIPLNAVIVGQDEQHVFVVEDGKSVKKEVTTGDIFEKWVEVKEGLSKTDQLIVEGHRNLEEGVVIETK